MSEDGSGSEMIRRARSLRREMTIPERRLWWELRGRRALGEKFRRQAPIGRFIVDFVHFGARLVVELDGRSHDGRYEKDAERQAWLERQGFRVLRIANDDVLEDVETVVEAVLAALATSQGK